jgi:lysyl endopeptidase
MKKVALITFFNFGVSLHVNYDFNSSGTWELLPDGSKLWRIHLNSIGALSNYLIFDKFFLPQGTELFAYNEDKTQILLVQKP